MKKYLTLFLIGLFLIGCREITDKERKDFEKEYKRHQQEEPYIPVPEI